MRQVEMLTKMLGKIMFNKELDTGEVAFEEMFDENGLLDEGNFLLYELRKKLYAGDVNGAENLLFERIEEDPQMQYLEVALWFYRELAKMGAEKLEKCDYTIEEIGEGLQEIREIYGISDPLADDSETSDAPASEEKDA